jgi:UDP-glucose 4-epimerase
MDILITGITGRIGANLAARLIDEGHEVRGLVWPKDPRTKKLESLDLELVDGSLTNQDDVERAVQDMDCIYHLGAAFQGGGPFTENDYFEINLRGTFNILEAARKHPSQLIFASTDAVLEKYLPGGMSAPLTEDTVQRNPRGWYALSKAAGEEMCLGYWRTYHLPVTVLRFCLVVGAGEILDFPQFYLSKLKDKAGLAGHWEGEERLVVLKDENGRSYKKHIAEVRDIVSGCAGALDNPNAVGKTIQLGGPRAFTWDEAVPYLSEKLEIPWIEARTPEVPTFYEFDLSKARTLLNFQPEYDIIRMIDDAVAYRNGRDVGILPTD